MSPEEARRVFQAELANAMRNLDEERARAMMTPYDHGDFDTFLTVHEEVYRFLADQPTGEAVDYDVWLDRVGHRGRDVVELGWNFLGQTAGIYYQSLDDTFDALQAQGICTNIFYMSHGAQILYEERLAAILNYRKGILDPARRYAVPLEHRSAPRLPMETAIDHSQQLTEIKSAPEPYASMDAVTAGECFVRENPKLSGSENGKRKASWVPKTRSQFDVAMRLLGTSIGQKPFWQLTTADIQHLLTEFDGLPPNHHKTPRHMSMSLADICAEAATAVSKNEYSRSDLGLNVPTSNRHFRFIRSVHDWMRRVVPQANVIDWSTVAMDDSRNARDQRTAFPVAMARELFTLPPWQGCESAARWLRPGRRVIENSSYWVFPILWYSGMRREEACKLMVLDVEIDEQDIAFFRIRDTEAGRLKNAGSVRLIPVADELIRLGFINFVKSMKATGATLLFPELESSTRSMGDSFYARRWSRIAQLAKLPDGITLHGIRHMVATELKDAGVSEEVRSDLLGHANDGETAGRYSKASRLGVLLDTVNKIPIVTGALKAR